MRISRVHRMHAMHFLITLLRTSLHFEQTSPHIGYQRQCITCTCHYYIHASMYCVHALLNRMHKLRYSMHACTTELHESLYVSVCVTWVYVLWCFSFAYFCMRMWRLVCIVTYTPMCAQASFRPHTTRCKIAYHLIFTRVQKSLMDFLITNFFSRSYGVSQYV